LGSVFLGQLKPIRKISYQLTRTQLLRAIRLQHEQIQGASWWNSHLDRDATALPAYRLLDQCVVFYTCFSQTLTIQKQLYQKEGLLLWDNPFKTKYLGDDYPTDQSRSAKTIEARKRTKTLQMRWRAPS
jgi:hypothetical protein